MILQTKLSKDDIWTVTGASGFLGVTVAAAILESGGDVVCLDVMEAPKPDDWGESKAILHSIPRENVSLATFWMEHT